jgi:hypothetical protein
MDHFGHVLQRFFLFTAQPAKNKMVNSADKKTIFFLLFKFIVALVKIVITYILWKIILLFI